MSSQVYLLCSIQQFLHHENWEGQRESGTIAWENTLHPKPSSWLDLKVQEFLHLCNWEGQRESGTIAWENSLHPTRSPWLRFTLTEFFRRCNWQGQQPESTNCGQLDPYTLLRQQVREFFQIVPWEGNPEIGKLPKAAAIPALPTVDEPTFTDLSGLF